MSAPTGTGIPAQLHDYTPPFQLQRWVLVHGGYETIHANLSTYDEAMDLYNSSVQNYPLMKYRVIDDKGAVVVE